MKGRSKTYKEQLPKYFVQMEKSVSRGDCGDGRQRQENENPLMFVFLNRHALAAWKTYFRGVSVDTEFLQKPG